MAENTSPRPASTARDHDTVSAPATLRRGMAVLEALTRRDVDVHRGLGVTEIAGLIGCDKSQVSRTLSALASLGVVERCGEGRGYRASWALYALGIRAANVPLVRLGAPVLAQLAAKVRQTTYLTVMQGGNVLAVWSESGADKPAAGPGTTWTLYASAAGTALLVDHTRAEVENLLADIPLERFTPRTPTTVDQVYRRIAECQRTGHAVSDREWDDSLTAVAVPVRGALGDVIAAIAISGSTDGMRSAMPCAVAMVQQAARYLSGRMRRAAAPTSAVPIPRWLERLT